MNKFKFCVASEYTNSKGTTISYLAFDDERPSWGMHGVGDINNSNILWYDTFQDASKKCFGSDIIVARRVEDE